MEVILMKLDRMLVYKAFNLIICAISLIGGVLLNISCGKFLNKDMYIISEKNGSNRQSISVDEADDIVDYFLDLFISYDIIENLIVESEGIKTLANVTSTNENYKEFNYFDYIEGYFWTGPTKDKVIVVNEALAWKMFGTVYVVGNYLIINGSKFRIIGIVKDYGNALNGYNAWIPINAIDTSDQTQIENLYILPNQYNKAISRNQVKQIFFYIGRNEADFHISDMNRFIDSISNRYKTIYCFFGIIIILLIIKTIYRLIRGYILKKVKTSKFIALLLLYIISIFIIWTFTYNDFWNISTAQGFKDYIDVFFNRKALSNTSYLSYNVFYLSKLNDYANAMFLLGLFGGINFILHFIMGHEKLKEV